MNFGKETEFVEFKLSLAQLRAGIESLSAMLNKHGEGKVIFGVNDDGDIIGLKNIGNKTIRDISQAIAENLKPRVIPTINLKSYKGLKIIILSSKGSYKPYAAYGQYLIRSGSENKRIEPELLKDIVFTNSQESIVNMESYNQELFFSQLTQLFISKGLTINKKKFAKNNNLLCPSGKYNLLANILSDNNDVSIKVIRFSGTDKSEMISRNEYGNKCLALALQDALNYVLSFNETRVNLSGKAVREEIKLFDEKSLREAWINACVHTKWSTQIPPAIYIYKDKIEIVSTGGLPLDFDIKDFFNGVSHPINRQLIKIMGQLGIVEQTGHGVLEIVKKYGREAFLITSNNIKVTLKFPFEMGNINNKTSHLNISQKRVYNAIKINPLIKTNELTDVAELKISRINVILRELKDLGFIARNGSNKNGYWEIIK